jgi:hypothetical protein
MAHARVIMSTIGTKIPAMRLGCRLGSETFQPFDFFSRNVAGARTPCGAPRFRVRETPEESGDAHDKRRVDAVRLLMGISSSLKSSSGDAAPPRHAAPHALGIFW